MADTVTATDKKTKSNSLRLLVRKWVKVQNAPLAKKKKKKEMYLNKTEISQHNDAKRQTYLFCFDPSLLFILLDVNLIRSPLQKSHWFQIQDVESSRLVAIVMTPVTKNILEWGDSAKKKKSLYFKSLNRTEKITKTFKAIFNLKFHN